MDKKEIKRESERKRERERERERERGGGGREETALFPPRAVYSTHDRICKGHFRNVKYLT